MSGLSIEASLRTSSGKGIARSLRRENKIPAIFYGKGVDSVSISVEQASFLKIIKKKGFENTIIDLILKTDEGQNNHKVLVKDLQVDNLKSRIMHVDFYAVSMEQKLMLNIPIVLEGILDISKKGIAIHQSKHSVSVSCLPDNIPENIIIDISVLDVNDSVFTRDLSLPDGVSLSDADDIPILHLALETKEIDSEEAEESDEKGVSKEARDKK